MLITYDDAKDKNVATYLVLGAIDKLDNVNYLYNEDHSMVKDAELFDIYRKGRLLIQVGNIIYPAAALTVWDSDNDDKMHYKVGVLVEPEEGGTLEYVWYFTAEAKPDPGPKH